MSVQKTSLPADLIRSGGTSPAGLGDGDAATLASALGDAATLAAMLGATLGAGDGDGTGVALPEHAPTKTAIAPASASTRERMMDMKQLLLVRGSAMGAQCRRCTCEAPRSRSESVE